MSVGLKVDSEALPPGFLASHDLNDPATTVELIQLNAVVGVEGPGRWPARSRRVGITCALCHSTCDNSVMPGIGRRLDGWPNRDLNPGAIIALSPALDDAQKAVYNSWGPGRYDPRFNIDGINRPVVIPPAFGLKDVGVRDLHRRRPRLVLEQLRRGDADGRARQLQRSPPRHQHRADAGPGHAEAAGARRVPVQPEDTAACARQLRSRRRRGAATAVFRGPGRCAQCHTPPTYTDVLGHGRQRRPGAARTVGDRHGPVVREPQRHRLYRTTPLRGPRHACTVLPRRQRARRSVPWSITTCGCCGLSLSERQKGDLVEFLKSL